MSTYNELLFIQTDDSYNVELALGGEAYAQLIGFVREAGGYYDTHVHEETFYFGGKNITPHEFLEAWWERPSTITTNFDVYYRHEGADNWMYAEAPKIMHEEGQACFHYTPTGKATHMTSVLMVADLGPYHRPKSTRPMSEWDHKQILSLLNYYVPKSSIQEWLDSLVYCTYCNLNTYKDEGKEWGWEEFRGGVMCCPTCLEELPPDEIAKMKE